MRAWALRLVFALLMLNTVQLVQLPAAAGRAAELAPICSPSVQDPSALGRVEVSAQASGQASTSIFDPATSQTRTIRSLSWLVLGICALIALVVEGVLLWTIIRYRSRGPAQGQPEPAQVYGSGPIELAWTVVPCVIVFVLTLATIRSIRELAPDEAPPGSLKVSVIGHQWWWEYRYEESGVVTANELVVPVGRSIWLTLESADVIHSWWVPRLAGKIDVVPNWKNTLWFNTELQGTYLGQCAEYCGTQHANMYLRVDIVSPEEFERWVVAQRAEPAANPQMAAGHDIFLANACANCHSVAGMSDGRFGPDLTHLMSRATIGSGIALLDADTLRAWVKDPQTLKPGCNMPSLQLDEGELDALVAWLGGLR